MNAKYDMLCRMCLGFMQVDEEGEVIGIPEEFVTVIVMFMDHVLKRPDQSGILRDFIDPIGDGTFYIDEENNDDLDVFLKQFKTA